MGMVDGDGEVDERLVGEDRLEIGWHSSSLPSACLMRTSHTTTALR